MTNKIKEFREQKGLTRKELAEQSGVHYKKVADYENQYVRTENITVGNLYKIAQALECKIDDLLAE